VNSWPRISAITLFVDDLDSARAFYEEAFGLSTYFEDPNSVVFKFGDTLINLLDEPSAPELISPAALAPSAAG
jgi:lactoylglutathione lyase